jgi:hypothetical protein
MVSLGVVDQNTWGEDQNRGESKRLMGVALIWWEEGKTARNHDYVQAKAVES